MGVFFSLIVFITLYFLPGFVVTFFCRGSLRQLFWWSLLLSYAVAPIIYNFLGFLHLVSFSAYVLSLMLLCGSLLILRTLTTHRLDLHHLLKTHNATRKPLFSYSQILVFILLGLFFLSLMVPRYGLWNGWVPVGDDKPRVGQVVSIALSPSLPLHFRLPSAEMSIYYYHMVQPGLLTKFSNNTITANQAWFLHLATTYVLFLWLIYGVVNHFGRNGFEKVIMVFGLTFLNGLEFYLALMKSHFERHLEWWTDWFGGPFQIHMQVSAPYTSSFYVTQHVISAFFVFLIYFIVASTSKQMLVHKVFIALLASAILGSSVFVFITFVLAYGCYELFFLVTRRVSVRSFFLNNGLVILFGLVFSAGMLSVLLFSGKESYFYLRLSNFHILENQGLFKLLNLLITVPFYWFIELSLLLLALIYSWWLLFKRKHFDSPFLFLHLLLLPFYLIFVFRAMGDNNFSMRSTLPAWIVLSVFLGWLLGDLRAKFKHQRILFYSGVILVLFFTTPTFFWELYHRYRDQFTFVSPVYAEIERNTPLQSIVFVEISPDYNPSMTKNSLNDFHENITHHSHRFTFKPVSGFTITDIEYTSESDKLKYRENRFSQTSEVYQVLTAEPHLNTFHVYYLTPIEHPDLPLVFESTLQGEFIRLYKLRAPGGLFSNNTTKQ